MQKTTANPTKTVILVLLILSLLNLVALSIILRPGTTQSPLRSPSPTDQPAVTTATSEPTEVPTDIPPTPIPSETPTQQPTLPPTALQGLQDQGVIFFSMVDGEHSHLFAYNPQYLPLTRLTDQAWDDIQPRVSPDGRLLAFSSNANGYWDLYWMDLETGQISQVTNTPAYDSQPTWSPDGKWLAFESYNTDHFEILLQSVENLYEPPVLMAGGPDNSYSPAWSPLGREIAFVSDRSGEPEIWLAALDQVDNRFTNLSQSPTMSQSNPAWSLDGTLLVWQDDLTRLVIQNHLDPTLGLQSLPAGEYPTWSPDGKSILALSIQPNQNGLIAYQLETNTIQLPYYALPGNISGLDWHSNLTQAAVEYILGVQTLQAAKGEDWTPRITISPSPPPGRLNVVALPDVATNYAYMNEAVVDSFNALRSQTASMTGWDFLASLENAYLPITSPPEPSNTDVWLFTGRGISIASAPLTAGWMLLERQELNGQTYWRVYLKARFQDGSQGIPLHIATWDIAARYSGDPQSYEQGGAEGPSPQGYWVDFTDLALRHGWERLPALLNWRTYFPATRFSMFVNSSGLNWNAAMLELYPPEALQTPTPFPTRKP